MVGLGPTLPFLQRVASEHYWGHIAVFDFWGFMVFLYLLLEAQCLCSSRYANLFFFQIFRGNLLKGKL